MRLSVPTLCLEIAFSSHEGDHDIRGRKYGRSVTVEDRSGRRERPVPNEVPASRRIPHRGVRDEAPVRRGGRERQGIQVYRDPGRRGAGAPVGVVRILLDARVAAPGDLGSAGVVEWIRRVQGHVQLRGLGEGAAAEQVRPQGILEVVRHRHGSAPHTLVSHVSEVSKHATPRGPPLLFTSMSGLMILNDLPVSSSSPGITWPIDTPSMTCAKSRWPRIFPRTRPAAGSHTNIAGNYVLPEMTSG